MSVIFRRFRRIVAIYCVIAIVIACFCMAPVSVQSAPPVEPHIAHNGEKVTEVTLQESGKLRLMAMTEVTDTTAYAWQILDPKSEDKWINITGANAETLWVTYALVGSMLEDDGTAVLRCALTEAEQTVYTDPVTVTVSFAPQIGRPVPQTLQTREVSTKPALRAADDGTFKTHSIVINYLFDDNTLAFEPYGATVAHGSDFFDTITSPTVVGYKPYRRVEGNYIDAAKVELNLTNIQSDIIINVVYEPTLVDFSVHHHLQDIYDDGYSVSPDFTTTSQAITGMLVPDGLALTEEALPGFRALAYEKLTVAADGSTVIEIRYDRNYYLVDFDMNGGYGTEPVYTRYGASVGANDPVRHGYVFAGWELVSYDGRTPTEEEASRYAISASSTITVPDANLRYRARWVAQETTYTMVFWKENAEDNGYSYWGYLDNLSALSGSIVDAQDWASRVSGIDDEAYFTFNKEKSDKSVLVEGDGSTVVNVYYTRNYYTITFKAPGLCTIEPGHTHGDACYDAICGRAEHSHSEACGRTLLCQVPEHTEHTEQCIACGMTAHVHGSAECACKISEHTHAVTCWGSAVGDRYTLNNAPRNPQNGQVYRSGRYYIYLMGSWYRYSAYGAASGDIVDPVCGKTEHAHGTDCECDMTEHNHNDSCYGDTLHTHTVDCYSYSCNQQTHIHTNACKRLKCGIPTGHKHSYNCTSSRSTNTVKLVHRKYQQSLADIWPVKDDNNVTYDSGERWSPSNSSYYNAVLVYISEMTPENFTLTLSTANYDTYIMNYYLQVLPGQPYDTTVDGKQYKLSHTINANYNYLTYAEDFFEIVGFDRASSSHKFTNNQIDLPGGGTVNFYYDRGLNPLTFNNNGIILDHKTVPQVQFEAPLKRYYFEPDYPSNLEPGAYAFAGWYTSPGCFDGTEVNWDTICMENGGLQLYAKWAPITHTVRVFKDATLQEQIGTDQTVAHQSFAHAPDGNVSNGNYVFQGWFYKDIVNGEEVEKAFVFTGIPITKDMDIYAKWSSHISVKYRIEYRLEGTEEQIADPTEGMAIAGNNKTFPAKAGAELYAGYQEGYYPQVSSHTITMSAEGDHVFVFYYVHVDVMPYKVLYVDAATGDVLDTKVVMDNGLSVVTETFIRFDGKMPDAYQKRLVLVSDGTDTDGDGILEENTITFYYNSDDEHAYYHVVHYIQNITGDQYREYRSEEAVGNIGEVYTFEALTLAGFTFNGALTKVNGVLQPVSGSEVSSTLGGNGLLVELYYQRNTVPYTVRYLDSKTGEEIVPSKLGEGVFGQQVLEYSMDLTNLGYELIGEQVRLLTLSADPEYNVLDFMYQERTVSLKYQLVGPAGCGSLSQTSQNVQAITGVASGSVPMANAGFAFQGWYLDAACTVPVPESWVDISNQKLVPEKVGEVWHDTTYYAKIIALETDLTIRTQGAYAWDQQTFLFHVVGKPGTETAGVDLTVSVTGNDAVTITKLPTGQYTVTELTSWSWRYDNDEASRELTLEYSASGTTVIFDNSRENGYWLDGNAVGTNLFTNQ